MNRSLILLGPVVVLACLPLAAQALPVDTVRPSREGCRSKVTCVGSYRPMLLAKR
jgi:hypothetical protein